MIVVVVVVVVEVEVEVKVAVEVAAGERRLKQIKDLVVRGRRLAAVTTIRATAPQQVTV